MRLPRLILFSIMGVVFASAYFWVLGSGGIQVSTASPGQSAALECTSRFVDLTTEELQARLREASEFIPLTPVEVQVLGPGRQVSRQKYLVLDPYGNRLEVISTECEFECGGQSCATAGCVVQGGRCSAFSCVGEGCSGACTKVSTN